MNFVLKCCSAGRIAGEGGGSCDGCGEGGREEAVRGGIESRRLGPREGPPNPTSPPAARQ